MKVRDRIYRGMAIMVTALTLQTILLVILALRAGLSTEWTVGIIVGDIAVIALLVKKWSKAPTHVLGEIPKLQSTATAVGETVATVIALVNNGQPVDERRVNLPKVEAGQDEFGDVLRALVNVAATAVRAAKTGATAQSTNQFLGHVARRIQPNLRVQLRALDALQRAIDDPKLMELLFEADAATMRTLRRVETLIMLGGGQAGRKFRDSVLLSEVARSAQGETQQYGRVTVVTDTLKIRLLPPAVADTIHLLAELIENALVFSPSHTKVEVRGERVPSGFVIEIIDRGLGLSRERMTEYNLRLASPPEIITDLANLGFVVVGKIAVRHGIRVTLRESPYGGTTAVVLIPARLLEEDDPSSRPAVTAGPGKSGRPTRALTALPTVRPTAATALAGVVSPDATSVVSEDLPSVSKPPRPSVARPVAPVESDEPELPRRVRQASLAVELRDEPPAHQAPAPGTRDPEATRDRYRALQRGTRDGRRDAATTVETDPSPN